ncbi:MAG: sigma-70 family RNA polymerase sigma factor [Planctomycetes bacterium]|nr:sigma-70 family RNA polymerase sigma factor [Planctomycetota bacterium]
MGSEKPPSVQQAFCELAPNLVFYARQWVELETAEDCVQDVFVRLMLQRRWPRRLKPWLYKSVRNQALCALRSTARRRRRVASASVHSAKWFHWDEKALIDADAVQGAMSRLSEQTREVLVLRIWAELTFEEISGVIGVSETAAFRRFRSGLAQIKDAMQAQSAHQIVTTTNRRRIGNPG